MRASFPRPKQETPQMNQDVMDQQYAQFVSCAKEKDSKELRNYIKEVAVFQYGGEHLKG